MDPKNNRNGIPTPPLWLSLLPLLVTGLALGLSVFVFNVQPHFSLVLGAITAGISAYLFGSSWETIKAGFKNSINRTTPSLLILLIIGMLIGIWIASGIVPAIMYYGFKFLVARWFLPIILLVCSVMALITGSSWSTIGTIGVASIGIGDGLGIPAAMTAGAIVSGSFFGDKISPMSDSTNLTSSVLGVNLYEHIKHMQYSTIPALIVSLIAFTIMGFMVAGDGVVDGDVSHYLQGIKDNFNLSIWLFIPPIAVIILILMKVPAIPSLLAGLILGGGAFVVLQDGSFKVLFETIHTGFVLDTEDSSINELFSRGGMESMYNVIALALVSLAFGGIMNSTKMLHSIFMGMSRFIKSIGTLNLSVILTSFFVNIFGANQYLAVILPGQMFEESYRGERLKLKNLTRALESGGTLTASLIPWNSSAVFIYTALGVSAATYAPFAILCWFTALVEIFFGYTKITMYKLPQYDIREEDECN
ncbi:MAG: Na+/H+ antiporter NhaC [Bacteroidetes bacterium]|jgi:NhaC family Na+:H+ antiporter|nr:Na+/H+ antiporter NhaC [Bacteroidota bacterium]